MSGANAGAETGAAPPGSGLAQGASLGRYVVLNLLGRGGMGEVYAAYDPELDRKIAVKLLRARDDGAVAGTGSSDARTRLLREAQAIARLSHPNVVVVYDVGTFRESVFIAMEFVEGNTAGYWLQAARRDWREVLEVFRAAGAGLRAAHEAGLCHRDFKPDNVMVTRAGQVRVMDFGLARELFGDADEPLVFPPEWSSSSENVGAAAEAAGVAPSLDDLDPEATADLSDPRRRSGEVGRSSSGGYLRAHLTQTGAVLGTPAYMAPEQFLGKSGDARTDQFSFCVALYEGLYGQRPFTGSVYTELMANVITGAVADPPADARVPAWLRRVLLRGLRANPDDRFPSMAALLAELAHDPAARRRRWLAAAAATTLVAALALGAHRFTSAQRAVCAGGPAHVAAVWGAPRREAARRAFAAAAGARGGQVFEGAAALLDQYLGRWTGMYAETCQATEVRREQSAEVLDLRMACLGERLANVRALTDAYARADVGVVDRAVGAADALPPLDRCSDVSMLRAVIRPPDDPGMRARVAAARDEVAKLNALAALGRCDQAKSVGKAVVATATDIGYLPLKAEALVTLGRLGEDCIDPATAIAHLEDAVFAAEASHHDEVAITASAIAAQYHSDRARDVRMVQHWTRHAEAILARFPDHPQLEAWVAGAKADGYRSAGRLEEALREHSRALALKQAVLGPTHVDCARSAVNVAVTLHELGRDAEAEPYIRQAAETFTRLGERDSTDLALVLIDEGEILTALRRFAPARAAIERALAIWTERGASPFFRGYGLLDLGRLELAEGRPQVARHTLEQAVELLRPVDPRMAAEAELVLASALKRR